MWMLEELATGEGGKKRMDGERGKKKERKKVGGGRGFHFVSIWQSSGLVMNEQSRWISRGDKPTCFVTALFYIRAARYTGCICCSAEIASCTVCTVVVQRLQEVQGVLL
jgi:hypothetical protein